MDLQLQAPQLPYYEPHTIRFLLTHQPILQLMVKRRTQWLQCCIPIKRFKCFNIGECSIDVIQLIQSRVRSWCHLNVVNGSEIRNIHIVVHASYTIYSHCLFIFEEAYTTMIIVHSTGEEVIVLCTSTIIFFLSGKLYRWHSLCYQRDHKGNGTPCCSSLKNDHDQTLSVHLPFHALVHWQM